MSIATAIQNLQQAKADIAEAIEARGIDTTGHGLADYATDIKAIHDPRLYRAFWAGGDVDMSDCEGMLEINQYTFYRASAQASRGSLGHITLPDTVTTIGQCAFQNNNLLTMDELPSSLAGILPTSVFHGCSSLKVPAIPAGVTEIQVTAFYGSGLSEIDIPSSVVKIGHDAFASCSALQKATISAQALDPYVFANDGNLRYVWLSADCTTITATAWTASPFRNCGRLTDIYCEATSKPAGWSNFWNCTTSETTQATVHWGVSRADFEAIIA